MPRAEPSRTTARIHAMVSRIPHGRIDPERYRGRAAAARRKGLP